MCDYSMLHNTLHRTGLTGSSVAFKQGQFDHLAKSLATLEESLLKKIELRDILSCPPHPVSDEEDNGGLRQRDYQSTTNFVSELSFSSDGLLLVANTGESLHIFDPNRGKVYKNIWCPHANTSITNFSFYSEKKFLYSTTNGCIGFWDVRKLNRPLNFFKAHSDSISKLLYDKETELLLSADKDGHLNYWYLPAFEREGTSVHEHHRGRLSTCPMLNQMCFINDRFNKKLVLFSSNSSLLYVVDNLDLEEFTTNSELKKLTFGESFKMYLGMNPKMADKSSKNHLWCLDSEEFVPFPGASISNISHMSNFPDSSVLLMRLSTSNPLRTIGQSSMNWTACVRLKDRPRTSFNIFGSYGSNVMHESLLYSIEESRYCALRNKSVCYSPCCRLIASPQKSGIKLLTFSHGHRLCSLHETITCSHSMKHSEAGFLSIFSSTSKPKTLHQYDWLNVDTSVKAYPLCCKFSPFTGLLAAGDSAGRVSFYQPRL